MKSPITVRIAVAIGIAIALVITVAIAIWVPAPTVVPAGVYRDTEAPNRDVPHGDFTTASLNYVLPHWWWGVPLGVVILVIAPVVFWKHRRGYIASVSLVLCVWVVLGWKRSYRGQEIVSVLSDVGLISLRDAEDTAMYHRSTSLVSSEGGINMGYGVMWVHPGLPPAAEAKAWNDADFAESHPRPNAQLSYLRDERLFYPGMRQETSVGLISYGHAKNHGYYTIAAQVWRQPPNPKQGATVIVRDGIVAPYWLLLVLFLIPPLWWMIRFWRLRYRKTHTRCLKCGYDLRASEERCPECGTAIAKTDGSALEPDAQPSAGDVHHPAPGKGFAT